LPRAASSSSQVGRSPRRQREPAYGLKVKADEYPLLSEADELPPIRVLTAGEYTRLVDGYEAQALPEVELFPWSHGGADLEHSPASQYFGYQRGHAAKAPR